MARIVEKREAVSELFPLSLIAVSDDLYSHIIKEIKKQLGEMIKGITKEKIEQKIRSNGFEGVVITTRKKTISLSVAIESISSPPSYEYGVVNASLLFPLRGECGKLKKLIEEIAGEAGIKDFSCNGIGMEIKIVLTGEAKPYKIEPNPYPSFNGKSQKSFATRKDLAACSPVS